MTTAAPPGGTACPPPISRERRHGVEIGYATTAERSSIRHGRSAF